MSQEPVHRSARRPWAVLAALLGVALSLLPASLMSFAQIMMAQRFALPAAQAQLFNTALQLGMLTALLPAAAFADWLGQRGVFLAGVVLLVLASAGFAFADALMPALGIQVVQGIAAAMLLVTSLTLLARLMPPHRLGLAMGLAALAGALAAIFGPVLGGLLMKELGQIGIFATLLVLGPLAFALALATIPPQPGSPGLDWLGSLLAPLGFGLIFLSRLVIPNDPRMARWMLIGGAFLTLLLILQQALWRKPALRALAHPGVALAGLAELFATVAAIAANMALVPHLLSGWHLQIQQLGLLMIIWPAAAGLTGLLAGWWADRVPTTVPRVIGALLLAGGMLALAHLPVGLSPWAPALAIPALAIPALAILACGIGTGLFHAPNAAAMLAGNGAVVLGLARAIGLALGPLYIVLATRWLDLPDTQVETWLQLACVAALVAAVLSAIDRRSWR